MANLKVDSTSCVFLEAYPKMCNVKKKKKEIGNMLPSFCDVIIVCLIGTGAKQMADDIFLS